MGDLLLKIAVVLVIIVTAAVLYTEVRERDEIEEILELCEPTNMYSVNAPRGRKHRVYICKEGL